MTTHNLEGRTCLITGASSGIGAHLAQAMAQAGARVALGARRTDLTEQIASEIREAGGEALAVSMDVTREASVAEAFERATGARPSLPRPTCARCTTPTCSACI